MLKIFKNDKYKLNAKQIKAIELLVNCVMAQKDVAVEVGVSEKTLYNWLRHNDEFRNAMEWYRQELYKDYAPEAAKTLIELMRNSSSDKVRLQAVKDVLERAGDGVENSDNISSVINDNIKTIAELINKPNPNRNINRLDEDDE